MTVPSLNSLLNSEEQTYPFDAPQKVLYK